ncbi:serine hydrolase domain-containing protein [Marinobacter sp. SS21]|uniref:serine hydrolase domain-containing protein n=1 Tax=Marinobacter sp. SS21 TaxID=2979460 RepID=UPI00232BF793|nr:serine hydrolase domain-containing protein [Marinobacter sp. SS21]MDC0661452.1 serine hydrolase [Marinobacter sp. SS21]
MFAPVAAETLGFNAEKLDEAIAFGNELGSTAIRVYRYGCLAGRNQWDAPAYAVPHPLASTSKGILALAVGRAVTLGHFGLDDPISLHLPQAGAEHGVITIRQLLNQVSGLRVSIVDEAAVILNDPVQYTLQQPFWYEPGSEFMYGQSALAVLSRIIEATTGQDFQDFTQQQLFAPLDIPRDHWVGLRTHSGDTIVSGGLAVRPVDSARLGHLMLYLGRWGDQQLIDEDFMRQALTGTEANPGYGFLLWLNEGDTHKASNIGRPVPVDHPIFPGTPRDAYGALGAGGQMIVVVPSRHLVIVRNGLPGGGLSTVEGVDYKEFVRLVTASVADMPQNTDPGPYTYPEGPSQFDITKFDLDVANWHLFEMTFGIGSDSVEGCSIFWCNGQSAWDGFMELGFDVAQQAYNAMKATTWDLFWGKDFADIND